MTSEKRESAAWNDLGHRRYKRYVEAFDRAVHCLDAKYYLEAIAILDSLIGDRLASRLGYLLGEEIPVRKTVGQLCKSLVGSAQEKIIAEEKDDAFRECAMKIQEWVNQRNKAMHATAKIMRSNDASLSFNSLCESYRQDATKGIELLQCFDGLDTVARRSVGRSPATYPNAFFPEKRISPLSPTAEF